MLNFPRGSIASVPEDARVRRPSAAVVWILWFLLTCSSLRVSYILRQAQATFRPTRLLSYIRKPPGHGPTSLYLWLAPCEMTRPFIRRVIPHLSALGRASLLSAGPVVTRKPPPFTPPPSDPWKDPNLRPVLWTGLGITLALCSILGQ